MASLHLIMFAFFLLQNFQTIFANSSSVHGLGVWTISNFHVFNATETSSTFSSISFIFPNSSTTTTTCGHDFAPGTGMSAIELDTYYVCEDPNVAFKYGGSWLAVTTVVGENGSMTTTFGNTTLALQCYSTSISMMDGKTCEMPTSQLSIPIVESTLISDTDSLSSIVKAKISNALAEISDQSASTFANGMQKRWINTTNLMARRSTLDERQLASIEVANFVGQNYAEVTGAASDIGFDVDVPTLGITTHCGLTRSPGQGSAATGTFQPCNNPTVSYNWTSPLSIDTKVTVPNVISGTTTTLSANLSLTGYCIDVANNGSNVFSAGNLCVSTAAAVAPIQAIVDTVGSAASSIVSSILSLPATSLAGVVPSTVPVTLPSVTLPSVTSPSITLPNVSSLMNPLGVPAAATVSTPPSSALMAASSSTSTLSYLAYNGTTTSGQTQIDAYSVAVARVCLLLIAYLLS